MTYRELFGAGLGTVFTYLLTKSLFASFFGGLLGYFLVSLYDEPHNSLENPKSTKEVYRAYPEYNV